MNKGLIIGIIVVLLVLAGALGYAYMNSSANVTSLNNRVSTLKSQLNSVNSSYMQLQQNYTTIQDELSVYKSNINSLKNDLSQNSSLVVLNAAFSHWDYIAIENSSLLSMQYASNATLNWIGGPLSGTYSGVDNITDVWNKFFGLWSAVWFYTPSPPSVTVSGNSANVSSEVQFVLTSFKTPLEVDYLNITYYLNFYLMGSQWLITHEVWHIESHGPISYTYNYVSYLQSQEVMNISFSHWDYIAIENTSLLVPQYYSNATLIWIGGPLSGTYNGIQNISAVWNRFFGLWSAVWFYTVNPPTLSESNGNYYVNATVQWVLTSFKTPMQVNSIITNYTLEFQMINGVPLITYEIWHIVGAQIISYSASYVESLQSQALLNASFSHWNNIAIENLSLVMTQYEQNSSLQWIGGKLAGNYTNYTQISQVWNKFFSLWAAVWFYSEAPPMVTLNISGGFVTGGTVTADIQFVVQSSSNTSVFEYIDVVYTLDFQFINGKYYITHEIFDNVGSGPLSQVAPFT